MQLDVRSKLVEKIKGEFLAEVGKMEKPDSAESEARQVLESWDGQVAGEGAGALIFEQLYVVLLKNLIEDELGPDLYKEYAESDVLAANYIENILADRSAESVDDVRTAGVCEIWRTS